MSHILKHDIYFLIPNTFKEIRLMCYYYIIKKYSAFYWFVNIINKFKTQRKKVSMKIYELIYKEKKNVANVLKIKSSPARDWNISKPHKKG